MTNHSPRPPTTTHEQNLKSASQRAINKIWELTQAVIAISVVIGVLYAAIFRDGMDKGQFIFLTNVLFVVIGFYFGRTNHQKTGGIDGENAGSR